MAKMPPPGGDGHGVAIMIGVPKGGDGKMAPPGMEDKPQGSGKVSAEEAGAVMADAHCIDCQNYHPDTGECDKVDGSWSPDDACVKYFQPVADDESAESESGSEPGMDAAPPQGDGQ